MTINEVTYKGFWEAPRWMKVEDAIKRTAFSLDLACQTQVSKGIICEDGVFKVTGQQDAVIRFKNWFKKVADF